MKRFILSLLFLLVATSLFAKKIEIRFWHILGYHVKAVIEEMIDEYNHTHTNVYVKPDFQGFFEEAQVKMLTAAITRQLPDVAQIPFEFLQSYVENGFIEPINNELPEDLRSDVMEKMWKIVERDGNIYGLPFCVFTDVFFYNENAFLKAGLDPEVPPSTWDEMVEIGKKLSRDTDGDGVLDSYAMTFYLSGIYGLAPVLWANGGSIFTDDGRKVNLTSKEMEKTISMVYDLIFKHKIMPQKWTDWESAQAFLMGKLAMGWFISPGISYSEENLPWTLKVSHIPQFNGKRYALLSGTALVNFSTNRRKRRAANNFMYWLINKENDIKLYEKIGFVPIRKSALNSLELKAFAKSNPNYRIPLEALEYAHPLPNHPEFLKINKEISNMLQRIILNEADLDLREELVRTEQRINEMLE
jgi:sn-glycerol 3-phosphate transport system substrate-binding protein